MIIMLQSASDVDGVGGDDDHDDDGEDGNLIGADVVIVKDTIFPRIFAFHYWASWIPDQDGDGLCFEAMTWHFDELIILLE